MAVLGKLGKYSDLGLLIMRIGVGAMMIVHGYPKLIAGPEKWGRLGKSMEQFGISYAPEFWGFMASFAESIGGLLLIVGWMYRPATLLLLITMIVASAKHLGAGDGIAGSSHPIELAFVFFGLLILGPGKYSIDKG